MTNATRSHTKLEWTDGRWHCDGSGIHAGSQMELRGGDGQWFAVRVEYADCGRKLFAHVRVHDRDFVRRIEPGYDRLRWPQPQQRARRHGARRLKKATQAHLITAADNRLLSPGIRDTLARHYQETRHLEAYGPPYARKHHREAVLGPVASR